MVPQPARRRTARPGHGGRHKPWYAIGLLLALHLLQMSDFHEDKERFGVPPENRDAALRRQLASAARRRPWHTRVPTRNEVLRLPPEELTAMLVGWMEHSPVEIIPSPAQIQLVIEVLLTRPDAPALEPLLSMCRNYASPA